MSGSRGSVQPTRDGNRRRGWTVAIAVVVAAVLIGSILALLTTDRGAGRSGFPGLRSTSLEIVVEGLPAKTAVSITVRGPMSYRVTSQRDVRQVPAGHYTISPAVANIPSGVLPGGSAAKAYPAEEKPVEVDVREGGKRSFHAAYVTIIPESTRVLDASNPGILAVSGTRVTFDPKAKQASDLVPGSVFVVAEGPKTPFPLARRIRHVERTAAGLVADTEKVPLTTAIPAGRLHIEQASGLDIVPALYEADPMLSIDFSASIKAQTAWEIGRGKGKKPGKGSCEGSAPRSMRLDYYGLGLEVSGDLDWSILPRPKVKLKLTSMVNPHVRYEMKFEHAIKCNLTFSKEFSSKGMNKACRKVIGKLLKVGPIHLRCTLEPSASVDIEAKSELRVGFDSKIHGGLQDSKARFDHDTKVENPVQQVIDGVGSSAKVKGTAGLEFKLEGGDPTDTAWLGIGYKIELSPGFTVERDQAKTELGLKVSENVHLDLETRAKTLHPIDMEWAAWTHTWKLWSAGAGKFRKPGPKAVEGALYYLTGNKLIRLQNGKPETLLSFPADSYSGANSVTISPDGRKLAWVNGLPEHGDVAGPLRVRTIDDAHTTTYGTSVSASWSNGPFWLPGSNRLLIRDLYTRGTDASLLDVRDGDTSLGRTLGYSPVLSPNGKYEAYLPWGGKRQVVVAHADGKQVSKRRYPVPCNSMAACDLHLLSVSPDGRYVVVGPGSTDPTRVLDAESILDMKTGKVKQLPTEIPRPAAEHQLSILFRRDGSYIVRTGGPQHALYVVDTDGRLRTTVPEPSELENASLLTHTAY